MSRKNYRQARDDTLYGDFLIGNLEHSFKHMSGCSAACRSHFRARNAKGNVLCA